MNGIYQTMSQFIPCCDAIVYNYVHICLYVSVNIWSSAYIECYKIANNNIQMTQIFLSFAPRIEFLILSLIFLFNGW